MPKLSGGRTDFRDWIDLQHSPNWPHMPLTHISKSITAADIAKSGHVELTDCEFFGKPLAYFFYGRPAYRVGGDGAIKSEAVCPSCFIFEPTLIDQADAVFAFDTGAFSKRMYKHMLPDEMNVEDFSLEKDTSRAKKLIAKSFGSRLSYFQGDVSQIPDPTTVTKSFEFHARSYLHLVTSPGRNEPDDRIYSIEAIFEKRISLKENLVAVIVPHTLYKDGAPWLKDLESDGKIIKTYVYVPGRHPEYYQAQLESEAKVFYEQRGWL